MQKIIFKQFQSSLYCPIRYNYKLNHFKNRKDEYERYEKDNYLMTHPIWTPEEVNDVKITHYEPFTNGDKFGNALIWCLRHGFDYVSGYKTIFPWQSKIHTEQIWLHRLLFLETVAGVPGFVAAIHRHFSSLRNMERDYGWIHTLLEEAENERMHLLTFVKISNPGKLFRIGVACSQLGYSIAWTLLYIFQPRVAHRIVGYLEEEAVKTYTVLIEEIQKEGTSVSHWKTMDAPKLSKDYWRLADDSTMLDVCLAIRKDEEHHRDVNHKLGDDFSQMQQNPYGKGK